MKIKIDPNLENDVNRDFCIEKLTQFLSMNKENIPNYEEISLYFDYNINQPFCIIKSTFDTSDISNFINAELHRMRNNKEDDIVIDDKEIEILLSDDELLSILNVYNYRYQKAYLNAHKTGKITLYNIGWPREKLRSYLMLRYSKPVSQNFAENLLDVLCNKGKYIDSGFIFC
ncbi:MAG: hypothetical protein JXB00_15110 [Bacteroidales bacterium]|nr:hypothetical protein [Bacteroidales bacterium]